MLDALRKGAGTWIAKLFIALLIFSFAAWGVTDFLQGYGVNTAAKVGDTEVTLVDFERSYRQDLNRLSQQFGRALTPVEGASLGVPQQSLGRLVAEAALNNTAKSLQVSLSDERLASIIQSDPAFQGLNGRYDRTRLQQVLQASGYREDEYVVQRRRVAERAQIAEAVAGGLQAPISYLAALDAYQNETRSAEYLLVSQDDIEAVEDPTDDVLESYFEEKTADFRAPEYREIRYISLTPETLSRPQDVVEDDARAEYERREADFYQPERRKVRQMSFPSKEAAEEAANALEGGKTFDDLLEERNLSASDVSLGVMAKSDFLDESLGDAAFALQAGETSGALDGRFSAVILNVEEVLPEATQPFVEVREGIVQDLAREQAEREILDLLDEIEDARAGGAMLDEIGSRFSLAVDTPSAFDSSGNDENGSAVDLPDAAGLVRGAFDSDIGVENDVLQFGSQGQLWYDVTKVVPARDRELGEVKDAVVATWKSDELEKRLTQTAEGFLERLQNGTPLLAIAAEKGLEIQSVDGLKRSTPTGDFGQEALAQVFGREVGKTAVTQSRDGNGRLVFRVSAAEVPTLDPGSQQATALGEQLSQQIQDSILNQLIADQESKAGVDINQAAINQVIGLSQQP